MTLVMSNRKADVDSVFLDLKKDKIRLSKDRKLKK